MLKPVRAVAAVLVIGNGVGAQAQFFSAVLTSTTEAGFDADIRFSSFMRETIFIPLDGEFEAAAVDAASFATAPGGTTFSANSAINFSGTSTDAVVVFDFLSVNSNSIATTNEQGFSSSAADLRLDFQTTETLNTLRISLDGFNAAAPFDLTTLISELNGTPFGSLAEVESGPLASFEFELPSRLNTLVVSAEAINLLASGSTGGTLTIGVQLVPTPSAGAALAAAGLLGMRRRRAS